MRKREAMDVQIKASAILGLKDRVENVSQGTGRVLAKSMLGYDTGEGIAAPDGWYLPENRHQPAMIMTFMAPEFDITIPNCYSERLMRTCLTAFTGPNDYDKMTGILYNGEATRVFKCTNGVIEEIPNQNELHNKNYYLDMWKE